MPFTLTVRKTIFWLHLASGMIAGIVIAMMSATGIAIAFEEEILEWSDRNAILAVVPKAEAERMTIAAASEHLLKAHPDFPANYVEVPADRSHAYAFYYGRKGPIYVNPYNGAISESNREAVHHWIHTLEEWHRFFGGSGKPNSLGRLVTGISNLAFVFLCLSGLYLWFPRRWSWRAIRSLIWFRSTSSAKARDFNWHNVFGFWNLPVLFVLAATAVPISFEWGHKLPFLAFGEEPPEARNFGMMAQAPLELIPPSEHSQILSPEALLASAQAATPNWVKIGLPLLDPKDAPFKTPLSLDVYLPDYMPNRAWLPVEMNPYTGKVLRATSLADRSPGLQARVWIRFLHTGAAFGFWGKIIASIASFGALVLVYTGFSLSYHRFFGKSRRRSAQTPGKT